MTGPATVRVTPQEFDDAGRRIAGFQDRADGTATRLRATLGGLAAAAGDDAAARDFDRAVLPAADRAFAGLSRLSGLVGGIGQGLGVSAENHRRGDAESAPGSPSTPFPPITARPAPAAAGAPSLVGRPGYWVPDWAERYWPNGDPDRLRSAASAWFAAADEVTSLGADVHAVLSGLVDTNDGDDVRALAAYWDRVGRSDSALFVALPRTCTALGQTCVRFAAAIDDAHRAMLDVIGQVLLGAVLVGVGIALTVPTLGGSDVVAGGAGAAAIATAVGELGTLAAALLATVGTAVAVTGVVTAGDALVAAIDNAPDPRVTQADISRVGDGLGKGSVDESARTFLPHERRTADRLAERGHDVRARPEDHSVKGRKADADVDGVETEFKSVTQEGKQDSSTIRNQLNDSKRDGGQSRNIVIDGADSELTATEADRGIKRFIGIPGNYFDKITIITREGWVTWP